MALTSAATAAEYHVARHRIGAHSFQECFVVELVQLHMSSACISQHVPQWTVPASCEHECAATSVGSDSGPGKHIEDGAHSMQQSAVAVLLQLHLLSASVAQLLQPCSASRPQAP